MCLGNDHKKMKNWLFLNAFTLDFAFLVSLRKEKTENFPSFQFEKSIERERERRSLEVENYARIEEKREQ